MRTNYVGKIVLLFLLAVGMVLGISGTATADSKKPRYIKFFYGTTNVTSYNNAVPTGDGGTVSFTSTTDYGEGDASTSSVRNITAAEADGDPRILIPGSNDKKLTLKITFKPNIDFKIKTAKLRIQTDSEGAPSTSDSWTEMTNITSTDDKFTPHPSDLSASNTFRTVFDKTEKNKTMYVWITFEAVSSVLTYYTDVFPDIPVSSAYSACWKLVSLAKPINQSPPNGTTTNPFTIGNWQNTATDTPYTINLPSDITSPYPSVGLDTDILSTNKNTYNDKTKFWFKLAAPADTTDDGCELEAIKFGDNDYAYPPPEGTFLLDGTPVVDSVLSGSFTPPDITASSTTGVTIFKFRHKGFYISTTVDSGSTYPGCGNSTSDNIAPSGQAYYDVGATQPFFISVNPGCAIKSVIVQDQSYSSSTGAFSNYGAARDVTNQLINNTYTFTGLARHARMTVSFISVSSSTADSNSYCQLPAFLGGMTPTKPNVLLIFDTSGSMGSRAYSTKTYTCKSSGSFTTLDLCSNFYGYFDKTKKYTLTSGTWVPSDTAATDFGPLTGTTNISGNYLNYKIMQRVDVIRKILIGGRVDATAGLPRDPTATSSKTAFVLSAQDGTKVNVGATLPKGLIHDVYDKVRFGMMVFNPNGSSIASGNPSNSDGGEIINFTTSSGTAVKASLGADLDVLVAAAESSDTNPNGFTPLAETLYEAVRYFEGKTSAYNTSNTDYGAIDPVLSSCQKHFVILLTDGEPTNDTNVPTSTGTNVTDTHLSSWYSTSGLTMPTSLLGRIAYYAHNNDLRNDNPVVGRAGNSFSGTQNLNVYSVYAFGDGSGKAALQETAKYGSYTNEFTPPYSSALLHNNKPDAGEYDTGYYEATDGDLLEKQLKQVLSRIMSSTASGTAAAVANNKSGERGANLIQALFYPQWPNDSSIKWLGEMQALWYYLDPVINYSGIFEDTDNNKELNLLIDKPLPGNSFTTKSLWRAGAKLQKMEAADRKIYTPLTNSVITAASNEFKKTSANLSLLRPMMNLGLATDTGAITDTQAGYLIDYIRGEDRSEYRPRKVNFVDPYSKANNTTLPKEWKLADIINSTPQVQSSIPLNAYDKAYTDSSYYTFINSNEYQARNVVYSSSNDGLMHAFKLGLVTNIKSGSEPNRVASIAGGDEMGKEEWAFIPKQALPYLPAQADREYCHQCLVDGAPNLIDVSINKPDTNSTACTDYWDCERKSTVTAGGAIVENETSWRTLLISGMGLGGATRDKAGNCNETLNHDTDLTNNRDCVKTPKAGIGLSSFFALDVTTPLAPTLKWEFSDYAIAESDRGLGFTSAGSAIVRINARDTDGTPNKKKNGRWFAVFASGPTGAIDSTTRQFLGRSDQNLKIYIVDLNATGNFVNGVNYWVKDTGIKFAFASSLSSSVVDLDRWDEIKSGYYSDDLVYITYTKASLTNLFPTAWDKGGVVRLVTNNDPNPANWFTSSLIGENNDIGPITSSIGKLQDRDKKKLWIYFGEGRYFYSGDEVNTSRRFFGVEDPCYTQYSASPTSALATTKETCGEVSLIDLQDQGGTPPAVTLTDTKKGWFVTMDAASGTSGSERVVSDVTASTNGIIFYTTFTPNSDVCLPGGTTSLWAVKYDTGGTPPAASLVGKAPVQTSSGGITLIDLGTKFTDKSGRKLDSSIHDDGSSLMGMASSKGIRPLLSNKGLKKILHIQER